ncbi:hypothetical protein VNO80_03839 [Phaseolus coccineus]|uniref:Uncharacterized protein n=1 Tax=Phaseolus coccineus TaxID=3886 RepID=A0AAN9NTY1_PHACN
MYGSVSSLILAAKGLTLHFRQHSESRVIVHDSDRTRSLTDHTRSLLLAPELFPVHCHVEHGNDDLGKTLEVLDGVEVKSDDVGDLGGACRATA